ncbi:MAG: type VI secretion system contractile sheath domain-containing protein [Rhodothalassiaceae bacterium]
MGQAHQALDLGRLPFRILVLGQFSDTPEPEMFDVERTALDGLMPQQSGRLRFQIDHPLVPPNRQLVVDTMPERLGDLSPRAVARTLAPIQALEQLRAAAAEVKAGRSDRTALDQARAALPDHPAITRALAQLDDGPAAAAAPIADDDPLDRLLALVDTPDSCSQADPVDSGLAQIDALLEAADAAVARHPAYRARARAWYGLKFLIDRIDFHRPIRLSVLSAPRQDWPTLVQDRVAATGEDWASALPALIIADASLSNTQADLDFARALAAAAADVQAPLVIALDPGFLGLDDQALRGRHMLGDVFDDPRFAAFRALRDKPEARWLTLAFNDLPLAPEPQSVALPPVWAVAALIARAVAETGWPTDFTGPDRGVLSDPAQAPKLSLAPPLCEDLIAAGIAPVTGRSDRLLLSYAPLLAKPGHFGMTQATLEARAMAQLGYQLLAARVARWAADALSLWAEGGSGRSAEPFLHDLMTNLVSETGPGARVTVRRNPEDERLTDLVVRTGTRVLGGATVQLSFPTP